MTRSVTTNRNVNRLSTEELAEIFGKDAPIEAAELIENPEPNWTADDLRDRLTKLAIKDVRERVEFLEDLIHDLFPDLWEDLPEHSGVDG